MPVPVPKSPGNVHCSVTHKMPICCLHSLITYRFLTVPEMKNKAGLPAKLQPGSVDSLSAFAKGKTFSFSISFSPARKVLPSTLT